MKSNPTVFLEMPLSTSLVSQPSQLTPLSAALTFRSTLGKVMGPKDAALPQLHFDAPEVSDDCWE